MLGISGMYATRGLKKDCFTVVSETPCSIGVRAANRTPTYTTCENPDKFHTICLNFTSERCQKVERFIRKFIRDLTPDFNVSFSWKSVSLNNIILPRLKKRVLDLDSHSLVYRFRCDCNQEYIGETKNKMDEMEKESIKSWANMFEKEYSLIIMI